MRLHASCAARPSAQGGNALLLLGPPGSGKSDLLLRLLRDGFILVADDQVIIEDDLTVRAPDPLAGLLEVRGLGIFRLPFLAAATLRLAITLGPAPARLPAPRRHATLGVPEITLDPALASAPARAALALQAACGEIAQRAGAFAP